MPARKPTDLIRRHETAAETAQREERDAALRPQRGLSMRPPVALRGHPIAQGTWRRLMRLYGELEAEIVTRMDVDLLVDYCMLTEQVHELDAMRRSAIRVWEELSQALDAFEGEPKERYNLTLNVQKALKDALGFDGRADRKRDLCLKLRQSMYLTPRARAGATPAGKPPEEPPDPMELLLGEVGEWVNGDKERG